MRILNIMQCTQQGGMEQAALRLMQGLQARGHQLAVLSLNPLGTLDRHLERAGIPARGLPYRGALGWRSFPTLARELRHAQADALIMTGSNLLAMLALGRLASGHRLLAMHFHHSSRPDWQWRFFYGLARSRFNAVSYPSDFVRQEAERIVPTMRPKALTIRNPLQAPPLRADAARREARSRLGLPADAAIVGNAGWLIARKRFDVFLRTAARAADADPSVRFAIAGDGEERAALEQLARELGVADRVHWLGWQSDMRDFYLAVDVLLFNSDWDALGNTPVEAMTYGIPVVASVANGGLKEIIPDARFGYLSSDHDPAALADAVLAALKPAGEAMAQRGRLRAIELSDPVRIAGEVEEVLNGFR